MGNNNDYQNFLFLSEMVIVVTLLMEFILNLVLSGIIGYSVLAMAKILRKTIHIISSARLLRIIQWVLLNNL